MSVAITFYWHGQCKVQILPKKIGMSNLRLNQSSEVAIALETGRPQIDTDGICFDQAVVSNMHFLRFLFSV
jgi:hypothetical protein